MALAPLSMSPKEAVLESVLPSLYLPIAQVDLPILNPHEDKALQLKEVTQWLFSHGHSDIASKLLSCGHSFTRLRDKNGHEKYGRMACKKEVCPRCGRKGSRVHKTRVIRAKDRLMWAPVLGYYVFTLPEQISAMRLPREILNRLEKESCDIVYRHFKSEGSMARIHLADNKIGRLRIHINVLFPITGTNGIGRVENIIINAVRKEWTDFINKFFCLNIEEADANYSFATIRAKKAHMIKYVMRPIIDAFMFMTLSDEDKEYIISLGRWHNTRWFGKLSNALYKKYLLSKGIDPTKHLKEDVYLSNICPICNEKFRFIDIVSRSDLPLHRLRFVDNDTAVDFEIFAKLKELSCRKKTQSRS